MSYVGQLFRQYCSEMSKPFRSYITISVYDLSVINYRIKLKTYRRKIIKNTHNVCHANTLHLYDEMNINKIGGYSSGEFSFIDARCGLFINV